MMKFKICSRTENKHRPDKAKQATGDPPPGLVSALFSAVCRPSSLRRPPSRKYHVTKVTHKTKTNMFFFRRRRCR